MSKINFNVQMSVEEIIATLKNSQFPSIIVEGREDILVYRRLEDYFADLGATVMPAGGRGNVLRIFKEYWATAENKPFVVFIVDQDTWIFEGRPVEYVNSVIIATDGFSIENDMYRDADMEALLPAAQRASFFAELDGVTTWFALAVSRHREDRGERIDRHPNHILDPQQRIKLLNLKEGEDYPETLKVEILASYKRLLRGKLLLDLLCRHCRGHRASLLLDFGASRQSEFFQRIRRMVRDELTRFSSI